MHQGRRHNLTDADLGWITVSGHDLIANVRHRDNAIGSAPTRLVHNHAVNITTAHQRQRVRYAAIRINHDNRFAHPITHFGGHDNLQG